MLRWRRGWYRLWQAWATLTARPDAQQRQRAGKALSPALWGVFCAMPWPEQAHALRVWAQVGGERAPLSLQRAALLHDVGKAFHRLTLWERALAVVGRPWLRRWGRGRPRGWRRPFVVAARHATWGAAIARAAGADGETVRLIELHQSPAPPEPWAAQLVRLQQADDWA